MLFLSDNWDKVVEMLVKVDAFGVVESKLTGGLDFCLFGIATSA